MEKWNKKYLIFIHSYAKLKKNVTTLVGKKKVMQTRTLLCGFYYHILKIIMLNGFKRDFFFCVIKKKKWKKIQNCGHSLMKRNYLHFHGVS